MPTSIENLRDKFRDTCADRVRGIRRSLEQKPEPDNAALRDILGELHTIKGESAMVGFTTLSQVAHALEDLIAAGQREGSVPIADVLEALDILGVSLQQSTEQLLVDPGLVDLLREVQAAAPSKADQRSPDADPMSKRKVCLGHHPTDLQGARPAARWTRVNADQVDALCERLAETALKVGRMRCELSGMLERSTTRESARQLALILQMVDGSHVDLDEVTASAWALRLVPVAPALEDLMRHAKAIATSAGKQVQIEVSAARAELERSLLDELHEPLMHIVRNAVDHGIEQPQERGDKPAVGRLCCTAESLGADIQLSVEDDGRGMNLEWIRQRAVGLGLLDAERAPLLSPAEVLELVFLPGFTQRDSADSISGRGLGLNVARRKVEGLGGSLRVQSTPGRGTRFEMTIPSKLSKEQVLVIDERGVRYGIPARWVHAVVRDRSVIEAAVRDRVYRHHGELLPVRSLADWLGLDAGEASTLLVVEIGERQGSIVVGRLLGERDLVRRPADRLVSAGGRIVASGTLDDGSVVLLLRWGEVLRESVRRRQAATGRDSITRQPRILVVDDSPIIRDIVADILVNAGLAVDTADNGAAALERLLTAEIDLVISDVEMPRLDGFELLEKIRQRTEVLPVILLTTRSSPEDRRKAAGLGANAYVVKSEFQGSTLLQVVGRFVELRA